MHRARSLSLFAAVFTGVDLALVCYLVLGLISERVFSAWADALFKNHAAVALVICAGVFAATVWVVLRWTNRRSAAPDVGRRFLLALGGAIGGAAAGGALFRVAYHFLPWNWFSRGGEWNVDPLAEMISAMLAGAVVMFWVVFRRGWRKSLH
jgi:hypothetical protein